MGTFTPGKAAAGVLFVVIGSLCVLLPLLVYVLGGAKSAQLLGGWKTWMGEHNSAIMTVVLVVLGAKYVGDAVSGLAS
ncbi:GAP family protein [Streptomyces sp. DT224]|uniref:GAP family protein n=1 Tax=Streptomyces sp. DT224 TaxID=3393426 RepID=UPI003CEC4F50